MRSPIPRPFDDPVPAGVADFDLISFLFYYHDTTYMEVDRAQMNRKLFAALKPGGSLVIADTGRARHADAADYLSADLDRLPAGNGNDVRQSRPPPNLGLEASWRIRR